MNAIDRSLRLPPGQFYSRAQKKTSICLHHTVGGSARSSFDWWVNDPRVIGTAYLVERDGTIYEVFPPECWAGHLACHDPDLERHSIGIELASEGALTERDGHLWAFDGKRRLGARDDLLMSGRVVRFGGAGWRGYQYFDAYEDAQVDATVQLVAHLCDTFGIPRTLPDEYEHPTGDPRPFVGYAGIFHHACVRPDKSDLHPLFPWHRLVAGLGMAQAA